MDQKGYLLVDGFDMIFFSTVQDLKSYIDPYDVISNEQDIYGLSGKRFAFQNIGGSFQLKEVELTHNMETELKKKLLTLSKKLNEYSEVDLEKLDLEDGYLLAEPYIKKFEKELSLSQLLLSRVRKFLKLNNKF